MRYIIDIEGNDLLSDSLNYLDFPYKLNKEAKLWCISVYNVDTKEIKFAKNEECTKEWLKNVLADCTELITHNGIKFDLPLLQLFEVLDYHVGYLDESDLLFSKSVKITDTLINSRLFFPDRYGGHSLEVWGERVGENKIDFRQVCIDKGYISKDSSKGAEFQYYSDEMGEYCIQDTITTAKVFLTLEKDRESWNWEQAIKLENKLADKAIRRELLGFWFDKELAINCLKDLNQKMEEIRQKVEPLLPPKPMNKGELDNYTLPVRQISKKGEYSKFLLSFVKKHNCTLEGNVLTFENQQFTLPYNKSLKTHIKAEIDNLDHVKMYLISLGWAPTEWRERDLTKDSKKQSISYEKRIKALYKWYEETINGKYTEERFAQLDISRESLLNDFSVRLRQDRPVRVPTSPSVRVGLEKELCPNLIKLGEKVAFAKDFALYLTYKHRRNSIAGGDTEDMDFDAEVPNTGFLAQYREQDSRIPTPSIEIGASTSRYIHKFVCNIARPTSIYGKEMRSLFGCGKDALQLGFDFASLEARVQAHYCYNYTDGKELAKKMIAEKPNDIHTINSGIIGIPRQDVKSLYFGIIYGAQATKVAKMLNSTKARGQQTLDEFWKAMPAMRELKDKAELYWESTGRKYILGIDGRKIFIRSQHSILNALFQSAGVIATKYTTIFIYQELEKLSLCTDPLISNPDFCSMIEYHDEMQTRINPKLAKFEIFKTEEEATAFVKTWNNNKGQLSDISTGNNNFYITLPNIVSKTINYSINKTSKLLKLNLPLGFSWSVGRNWYQTH